MTDSEEERSFHASRLRSRLDRATVSYGEESWKLESTELLTFANCDLGAKWRTRRSGYSFLFVLICVSVNNGHIFAA